MSDACPDITVSHSPRSTGLDLLLMVPGAWDFRRYPNAAGQDVIDRQTPVTETGGAS
ncbi:hypothetical protein Mth01_07180 [Sphaerimonospora thailandensis]|uniref:Uncharacterized protein n=1 Tax=Sphaerimonospora thailandensis TaxID=795644 RepID=A0A8J3VY06_9ACTN|nr:hypothetical protein Mth01_07180 [Sphaerimonospora thailandensis]